MEQLQVAIRGCPRSGTHLGEWFLKEHFDVQVINSSRHRIWVAERDPEKVLLMVRDPVSWVVSMYRYVAKLGEKHARGQEDPLEITVGGILCRDCTGPEEFWYYNKSRLMEHRNAAMYQWTHCKADVLVCPYESLLWNPYLLRRLIEIWLKLDAKPFEKFPSEPLTEPKKEGELFDFQYYLGERWTDELILKTQLEITQGILL